MIIAAIIWIVLYLISLKIIANLYDKLTLQDLFGAFFLSPLVILTAFLQYEIVIWRKK